MVDSNELQRQIWKVFMANKIIVAKYIQDNNRNGFYYEMIADLNTADSLCKDNTNNILFADVNKTINQLDYLSGLGYVEKRNSEINYIKYRYTLYYSYPLLLSIGDFQLPGNIYPFEESILITIENFKELSNKLEEFKRNVNSGIYANILDFRYKIEKK